MTIVTARPPRKRPPKATAQPVEIASPRVVQHLPKWDRERKALPPDPEADARVAAFFRRMGLRMPDKA